MNNLKVLAACLFVVFIGLFIFDSTKKKETVRKVASIDERREEIKPVKIQKLKQVKAIPMVSNITPDRYEKGSIPEPKTLKKGEFPMHKGRFVAMFRGGKLIVPDKGSTKELIFSKEGTHPDIEKRAAKFFSAMGFDEDKKMKLERGKPYYLINGDNALKVDAFKVSYNWNGTAKKGTYLIRSATGRYYRKLRDE